MKQLFEAIDFIAGAKQADPSADKMRLQAAYIERFNPERAGRSVLVGEGYALRFSKALKGSFANTVLSLSSLQPHDARPFVVACVRDHTVDFYLANTTFLKKVSQSSHQLRLDNIRGSFNGTDIATEYGGIKNAPENFEALFAQHAAFSWKENLERLVEATTAIVARNIRFEPTEVQRQIILDAPRRAAAALTMPSFLAVEQELRQRVEAQAEAILAAARIDNVNLRGNAIEQLLTGAGNSHDLGDLVRQIDGGPLVVDIKTKLLDRASAPKAYNVDKMLAFLSEPGSVLAFLLVGVDVQAGVVSARLLPVLEQTLLNATGVQHHWAGRGSRGVTQLSGSFQNACAPCYAPSVDVEQAGAFLARLLTL